MCATDRQVNHRAAHVAGHALGIFAKVSWNGQEGGDLDTFSMTGWDPARETITSRSGLPRNA